MPLLKDFIDEYTTHENKNDIVNTEVNTQKTGETGIMNKEQILQNIYFEDSTSEEDKKTIEKIFDSWKNKVNTGISQAKADTIIRKYRAFCNK